MNTRILALGLVAGLLLVPSAVAVHGAPYVARGTATLGNQVFLAEVEWTGYWTRTFEVTLTDPLTNAVVEQKVFRGMESWNGPVAFGTEFFQYRGWSTDPSVDFEVSGVQIIFIYAGYTTMLYQGNYHGYELLLYV
jgi:hypothetical protein